MTKKPPSWNLKLLYASPTDPEIEKDVVAIEAAYANFAKAYDTADKQYLSDERSLVDALTSYEKLLAINFPKPLKYFIHLRDVDAKNPQATTQIPLLTNRLTKAENLVKFFEISLGQIPADRQSVILDSNKLRHFRFFLACVFKDAKHALSVPEEKIMSLKSQPSYNMWVEQNNRILNSLSVTWKRKPVPLSEAMNTIQSLPSAGERARLARALTDVLMTVAPFSEGEVNAIMTNKKINDELRGFKKPYEQTVVSYRNDPEVVEKLVKTVTEHFAIAHRFHRVKAKLLRQKKLAYSDRAAKIGNLKTKFSFEYSYAKLQAIFGSIGPFYEKTLKEFVTGGQVDALPKKGKTSGAYCWSAYNQPTFVLLNHIDSLNSFTTFAHEMGHAFHGQMSERAQSPLYSDHSTALAETASTLFEALALESVYESLSDREKIIVLHDSINDDIATVFRQIACFNFELELHNTVRAKGFVTKEEIAAIHNKHMKAYLGPVFDLKSDDGYMFVQWSHIRRFFYVYSYAYGQLVSKAMIRRYRKDKSFWTSIEQFLAAGGKNTPEEILKEIGIDVAQPDFFAEGLREIEDNIAKLEKLTRK